MQLATSLQFLSWGLGAPSSEKVSFFRASPSVEPDQQVPGGGLLIASLGLPEDATVKPEPQRLSHLIRVRKRWHVGW
jgi:hypothetical protein